MIICQINSLESYKLVCLIQAELCVISYRVILALTLIDVHIIPGYLLFLSLSYLVAKCYLTGPKKNNYLDGPNTSAAKFILWVAAPADTTLQDLKGLQPLYSNYQIRTKCQPWTIWYLTVTICLSKIVRDYSWIGGLTGVSFYPYTEKKS
jgi:hypothetical protein